MTRNKNLSFLYLQNKYKNTDKNQKQYMYPFIHTITKNGISLRIFLEIKIDLFTDILN